MKTIFFQFLYRLKLAFRILLRPKLRWVFITITEKDFRSLLTGEEGIEVNMSYHRMQEYNMWRIVQSAGEAKDEIDMMLLKAEFEAKAQLHSEKGKKEDT